MCDIFLNQQWQLLNSTVFPINPHPPHHHNLRLNFCTHTHTNNYICSTSTDVDYNTTVSPLCDICLFPRETSIHTLPPLWSSAHTLLRAHTHTHTSTLLLLYRDPFIFTCNIQIKQHVHVWAGGGFMCLSRYGWEWKEYACGSCMCSSFVWMEEIYWQKSSEYWRLVGQWTRSVVKTEN